jgi:hypothetical protein
MPNRNSSSIYLQLLLNSILLFVLYGLLNAQFTMRLSPDYFAIFYPDIFDASNPTLSAVVWGLRAMWWVGGLIGLGQIFIARFMAANELHPVAPKRVIELLSIPFTFLIVCACLIGGLIGYVLAAAHIIPVSYWFPGVPLEMQARFLAVVVWQGTFYVCCVLIGLIMYEMVFGMSNRGRRWL